MNPSPKRLVRFVLITLTFVETLLPFSVKAAGTAGTSAQSIVESKLLEPLQKKEANRSRFSRAMTPPSARRIRILNETPLTDAQGRTFVSFAVDEKRSFGVVAERQNPDADWYQNAIVGCVYPDSGNVMIKRGDVYYASSILLGKSTPTAPADVCRAR